MDVFAIMTGFELPPLRFCSACSHHNHIYEENSFEVTINSNTKLIRSHRCHPSPHCENKSNVQTQITLKLHMFALMIYIYCENIPP
jgi:hypothetical protein